MQAGLPFNANYNNNYNKCKHQGMKLIFPLLTLGIPVSIVIFFRYI